MNNIGLNISTLRKEKGVTQEDLAKYVGISAQAVSKWENGGVPDIELLPKIADYFETSIDRLFDRNVMQYKEYNSAFIKKIINTPESERFKIAFEYCWDIERALTGNDFDDGSIEDYNSRIEKIINSIQVCYLTKVLQEWGLQTDFNIFYLYPKVKIKNWLF